MHWREHKQACRGNTLPRQYTTIAMPEYLACMQYMGWATRPEAPKLQCRGPLGYVIMSREAFTETCGEDATARTMLSLAFRGYPHPFITTYFHNKDDRVVMDPMPSIQREQGQGTFRERLRSVHACTVRFGHPEPMNEWGAAMMDTEFWTS